MRIQRRPSSDPAIAHVACASNRAFLPHCASMLCSLLEHEPGPLVVHVFLDIDVPADDGQRIADLADRTSADVSLLPLPYDQVGDLVHFGPASSWIRMFLQDVLPQLDRLIYLDCDTIVLDTVRPLWETDLGDSLLGAVANLFPGLGPRWAEAHCAALGMDDYRRCFNAGVLLLDLARLRDGGYSRRAAEFAAAHGSPSLMLQALENRTPGDELRAYCREHPEEMLFADQDAMNAVMSDRCLRLHPRWNCMNQMYSPRALNAYGSDIREAISDPAIRHFEGKGNFKPWEPDSGSPHRELYWRYREMSWPTASESPARAHSGCGT